MNFSKNNGAQNFREIIAKINFSQLISPDREIKMVPISYDHVEFYTASDSYQRRNENPEYDFHISLLFFKDISRVVIWGEFGKDLYEDKQPKDSAFYIDINPESNSLILDNLNSSLCTPVAEHSRIIRELSKVLLT